MDIQYEDIEKYKNMQVHIRTTPPLKCFVFVGSVTLVLSEVFVVIFSFLSKIMQTIKLRL